MWIWIRISDVVIGRVGKERGIGLAGREYDKRIRREVKGKEGDQGSREVKWCGVLRGLGEGGRNGRA